MLAIGPGPEEGDHGRQVLHLGRLQLLDVAAHPRALELEDAGRLARWRAARRSSRRRAAGVSTSISTPRWRRISSTASARMVRLMRPRKSNFSRPSASQACISNWVMVVSPSVARWSGMISVSGSRLMTIPAAWVEAWRATPSSWRAAPISCSTRSSPAICSRSCGTGLDRALEADVQLVGDRLGHPVRLGVGEAHGPRRRRGWRPWRPSVPKVMIWATRSAPYLWVTYSMTSSRRLSWKSMSMSGRVTRSGFRKRSNGQPVGQRVDRRDAERVGHDAARRRSPAGGEDPLLAGEAGEVGHDQEVARVPHPVDHAQLVLEAVADLAG